MLTTLPTLKTRLGIAEFDATQDALLTAALRAVSARFDKECNRIFARTVDATCEFEGTDTEIRVPCYPIETVTKFEIKRSETEGWIEQEGIDYLVRRTCIISLRASLSVGRPSPCLARVTYTGGYVLPGDTGQISGLSLPDDLEQAAVEQVAYWFQHRDKLGLQRIWPHQGTYEQFAQLDLLLEVRAVLRRHERIVL